MPNKTLIYVIIAIVILGAAAGIYFTRENKTPANESMGENGPSPITESGVKEESNKEENILVKDDFSIKKPDGWEEASAPVGVSAIIVNTNEQITDPAAKKINFRSYFSVSYDTLQGKTEPEYFNYIKNSLTQSLPEIKFTQEKQITINNDKAQALEADLTQQGVDFKILMVITKGQENDVWIIAFNTLKSKWDGYKDLFYQTAATFRLK